MSDMMGKAQLVAAIADRLGTSRKEADDFLSALSGVVEEAVASGRKIVLPGIGRIETAHRGPRMIRNPRTGETIEKPEGTAIRMKPAARLKALVA